MKEFFKNYKKELKGTVVGILIGILVMLIFWPERIAELKDKEQVAITVDGKNITADSIYKGMKNKYSANEIVEQVDRIILDKKYTITDDDLEEIKKNAENYYSTYQSYYNITKEEFLKQNNFDSEDDFLKYLELDYKRNKLVNEYLETSVTDKEIEEYYNDNYFTPFKVEHILVKTKDNDNADTMVVLENEILGKPFDSNDAAAMLRKLSGRVHRVLTGVAVFYKTQNLVEVVETKVWFRSLSEIEINAYVATGEPFDKAGAYGIQGRGAVLVEKIDGCYNNVVGLPLTRLYQMMAQIGVKGF